MADTERMLRGREALTIVRGTPGRHVYRNEIVDPRSVYDDDRERLVREGFLEWVVRNGDSYTLAEDGKSGDAGVSVTVGTTSADVSPTAQQQATDPADPGLVNAPAAPAVADDEVSKARAAAREKLPSDGSAPDGRAGKEVHAEWLAGNGYDYNEVMKQDVSEVRKLTKQQSS